MAKPSGFIEFERLELPKREVKERIKDYKEIEGFLNRKEIKRQAARCMDCGIPYCHSFGCPLGNLIPDWNDMVYRGHWKRALELLEKTCNFGEFTGRICPAPCEGSCTLNIDDSPVNIRHIEKQIVERGWKEGWIKPQPASVKSGKRVAVVGSGPAGLVAAQRLTRAGHDVVVFEKNDRVGGLLRYGIPDFKLEKHLIDRRIKQMEAEGTEFRTGVNVGVDLKASYFTKRYDAFALCLGAEVPRDLPVPGRELNGVHFAMEFLPQQNKRNAGDTIPDAESIYAGGKRVVVIGGGDTGSDCIGTSHRHGAINVVQLEVMPSPPLKRLESNPWPLWPVIMRTSTSQDEGAERMFSIATKELVDDGKGNVKALKCVKLDWSKKTDSAPFTEVEGSEFEIPADLVLLAMGFVHTTPGPLIEDLKIERDARNNIIVDKDFMTSRDGVFSAGDSVRGASLVVTAMAAGRDMAACVDQYLAKVAVAK